MGKRIYKGKEVIECAKQCGHTNPYDCITPRIYYTKEELIKEFNDPKKDNLLDQAADRIKT